VADLWADLAENRPRDLAIGLEGVIVTVTS